MLTKADKSRFRFVSSMRGWNSMYTTISIFQFHYFLIDVVLLISQTYRLDIQKDIFLILLTVFNLELVLVLGYNQQRHIQYITYFLSGFFILTNLFLKLVTALPYHLIAFSFNWILFTLMARELAYQYKYLVTAAYTVYFFIFANFDGLLNFEVRWVMAVPLLLCLGLLLKFFKEVYEGLSIKDAFKMQRHLLMLALLKMADIGVFLSTSLPLYNAFISNELQILTSISLVWHLLTLIFYILFQKKILFYQMFKNRALYRLDINNFAPKFKLVPFKASQKPWEAEKCSKCCRSQVKVLFKRCGHFVVCKKCLIEMANKGWDRCLICNEVYYLCIELSPSFGEMSEPGTISEASEANNLYLALDRASILIESDSQQDIRHPRQMQKQYQSFLQD